MQKVIVTIAIITALIWAMKTGLERQQIKDCYRWQGWAEQSNLYQPSAETLAVCQEVGVNIK